MIERFFQRSATLKRLRHGPFADLIERYAIFLAERGHATLTVRAYVCAVEHFVRWLRSSRRMAEEIDEVIVGSFLTRHLPRCRCPVARNRTLHVVRAALRHLVEMLHSGKSVVPAASAMITGVLAIYDGHLATTCGLALATRRYYLREVRDLLAARFGGGPIDLSDLTLIDVQTFVTKRGACLKPSSANVVATAVRSFLRFLSLLGVGDASAVYGVPRAAQWRLAGLPVGLTDQQLKAFLAAFDRSTAVGRRDFAIALCLSELGLRASEVARLTLNDVDWRARTVTIAAGKGRRVDSLPLPAHVARAILDYVRRGRPATAVREIFVHHRAPWGQHVGPELVRGAVRRGFARAGLDPKWTGTHLLRRTAATRLLRGGASMKEIADVLRHRSLDSAAIYAKVDHAALADVALPWPEVGP